ncbi:unnamed protein product [Prunus armeniaca]|uniref:Uncharacterized protein n=1 Tax=Prunus armeniaca TaxID=36596 RepID=A0A6J5TS25_PRUAR|nr:unnamed protein product [Prunus armeniaca]
MDNDLVHATTGIWVYAFLSLLQLGLAPYWLTAQVHISREEAQPTVRVEVIKVAEDELMSIKPLKIFRIGGGRHITRGNYRKNRGEPNCIDSFDVSLGGGGAVEAAAVTVGEEGSG